MKAPKKDETATPVIKSTVTFILFPFFAILKIKKVLKRENTKARTPYIKSGKLKIKAITAPKVALAAIPIIYGSANGF